MTCTPIGRGMNFLPRSRNVIAAPLFCARVQN
nr:MAG TPA: hypothetical protein [Caudoviricetes sp.]